MTTHKESVGVLGHGTGEQLSRRNPTTGAKSITLSNLFGREVSL